MMKSHKLLSLLGCLALVLLMQGLAVACPTCKDALDQNDPNHQTLVRAWGISIIFMLSMPFTILTCLCAYFYYEVCKARRLKQKQTVTSQQAVAAR